MQVTFSLTDTADLFPRISLRSSLFFSFSRTSHINHISGGANFFSRSEIKSLWWAGALLIPFSASKFNLKLWPSAACHLLIKIMKKHVRRKLLMMSMKQNREWWCYPKKKQSHNIDTTFSVSFACLRSHFASLHDNKFIRHLHEGKKWSDFERLERSEEGRLLKGGRLLKYIQGNQCVMPTILINDFEFI